MYRFEPPTVVGGSLTADCTPYPACPELTTCILGTERYAHEKSDTDASFAPKVIVGVAEAKSYIASAKWQWTKSVFRSVPGASRVDVHSIDTTVTGKVTLTSWACDDGQRVDDFPNHDKFYTDIMDFSLEDAAGAQSAMTVEVYAPAAPHLKVFKLTSKVGTVCGGPNYNIANGATAIPTTASPRRAGWWRFTVSADGQYIGTTETRCPPFPTSFGTDGDASFLSFSGTGLDSGAVRQPVRCSVLILLVYHH